LYNTQQPGGFWSVSGHEQAATGAAAFAFLSQQSRWGSNAVQYQATVDKAIAYLISTAKTIDVGTRQDGGNICPGGSGSCKGVYWDGKGNSTYTTGLAAPAIAAYGATVGPDAVATTSGPLAGMTWGQIAQGITNALAASQGANRNGNRDGGWGHLIPGEGASNSSSTQWAVASFFYNETLGAVTSEAVKNELKIWLRSVQNAAGAVCYQPGTEPCDHALTGGWLLAMKFVGYELTESQVQAALSFLNRYWQTTANNVSHGNFDHPYAMWTVYQGLETSIGLDDSTYIVNFLTHCGPTTNEPLGGPSGSVPCTWWEDYNQWLVKNQRVDGNWNGYSNWTDPFAAAFYINILGGTRIPVAIPEGTKVTSQDQELSALTTLAQMSSAVSPTPSAEVSELVRPKRPRPRRRRGVTALDVSADGSALAGASSDNRIRIWSPTTGQQRLVLQGSLGLPTGLAFRNSTLSSVGRDSLVRVWDAVNGSQLARLAGHEHAIRAIAASADGRFLASAGEETRILLWDTTSRKLSKIFFGLTDFVNAISFSPDSQLLASADEDARVLIFDIAAGRAIRTLRGHSGPIDTVAFSPDGTVLASAGQDTVIHLWNPANGQQRNVLKGHSQPIRAVTFSSDGQLIASGGEESRILLWNATTGVIDKVLSPSSGFINALVFAPKAPLLLSASEAGEIVIWNVITGAKQRTIIVPTAP
jgi:WD40 repeat protein